MEDIINYTGNSQLEYDVVLIDIDSHENFIGYDMKTAFKNYFVTAFDNYSLKKGLEVIGKMQDKIKMTKILFSREMSQEEDDYLNFLSFYYSVIWDEDKIYFPYEQGDNSVIIENQRLSKIRFKELSQEYKESLLAVAEQIIPEIKSGEVRKAYRRI